MGLIPKLPEPKCNITTMSHVYVELYPTDEPLKCVVCKDYVCITGNSKFSRIYHIIHKHQIEAAGLDWFEYLRNHAMGIIP